MDGNLRMRIKFKSGKINSYSYKDKNGNYIPDITIKNETVHILAYYQNGNKSADINFVNGFYDGKFTYYHSNGKIEEEKYFKSHEEEGEVKEYYDTGQLKSNINHYYGLKDGISREYNEKGILIKQINYILGEKEGVANYYDGITGKINRTNTYVNNQPY